VRGVFRFEPASVRGGRRGLIVRGRRNGGSCVGCPGHGSSPSGGTDGSRISLEAEAGVLALLLTPCVGTHLALSRHLSRRGTSRRAFPRRVWEREITQTPRGESVGSVPASNCLHHAPFPGAWLLGIPQRTPRPSRSG